MAKNNKQNPPRSSGRPKRTDGPVFVAIGLRGTELQARILQRGAELDAAERRSAVVSRNSFCLNAALDAAHKLIHDAGETIPEE